MQHGIPPGPPPGWVPPPIPALPDNVPCACGVPVATGVESSGQPGSVGYQGGPAWRATCNKCLRRIRNRHLAKEIPLFLLSAAMLVGAPVLVILLFGEKLSVPLAIFMTCMVLMAMVRAWKGVKLMAREIVMSFWQLGPKKHPREYAQMERDRMLAFQKAHPEEYARLEQEYAEELERRRLAAIPDAGDE